MNINHRSDRGIFVDLCCGITNLILNKNPIITYHPNAVLIKKKYPSENINRKGEGGLRTKGYFKKYIKDNPLISVITVVFNGENDLEQTIKSVINQTYNNIEYIVIDGGSTDDTLSIIKKYEDKINYWVSEDDNGIYDAMNKGVGLAQGEWLCFINSGDIYISQNTLFDLAYALKDGSKLFIYSDVELWDQKVNASSGIYKCDHKRKIIIHQGAVYSKKLHEKYGLYLADKNISISDYLFFCLVPDYLFLKIHNPIARYNLNGVSNSSWSRDQKFIIDWLFGRIGKLEFIIRITIYPIWHSYIKYKRHITALVSSYK